MLENVPLYGVLILNNEEGGYGTNRKEELYLDTDLLTDLEFPLL